VYRQKRRLGTAKDNIAQLGSATNYGLVSVCALSFSCAIFLVLELDNPFAGLMGISSAMLRSALLPLNPQGVPDIL
jgi:hypothetical protein